MRTAILMTVCLLVSAGTLLAGDSTVSGSFKWGKKGGTITGTLTPTETDGEYTVKFAPVWGKKTQKGYDGTINIDAGGKVTGTIKHKKQGAYTLTGTRKGDKISCEYKGKKSKKGKNPLNLTIGKAKK